MFLCFLCLLFFFVLLLFLFCLLCSWFCGWMLLFCFFCVFLLFFVLFFGGFKGQVRWPKGPPHLALNPPYFMCFCFCFVSPLFCFLFFLNPPYFICFCVFLLFLCFFVFFVSLSLLLLKKKPVFPPKWHFCVLVSVSPFVSR